MAEHLYFSIIIPLYNKASSVISTINSVLAQDYPYFELIIVDDGSTDDSLKNVLTINDDRIRTVSKANGGVSSARNRGIQESRFNWIAFLDGDDLWKPNHLSTLFQLISYYPNIKVFSTSWTTDRIEISSNISVNKEDIISESYLIEDYFREYFTPGNLLWTGSVLIHKSCFNEIGTFKEYLSYGEDLDMWARLALNTAIVKCKIVTTIYDQNIVDHRLTAVDISKRDVKKTEVYYPPENLANTPLTYRKYILKRASNITYSYLRKGKINTSIKLLCKYKYYIPQLIVGIIKRGVYNLSKGKGE